MALHWVVVVLVVGAWLTGQFGDEVPRGAAREAGLFAHVSLGLAVVVFVIARLFWRLSDPPPALEPSPLGAWGGRASQAMHYLIYVALIAVPIAGIVVQFARGHALPIFGLFEIASPWSADRAFAHDAKEVHEGECYADADRSSRRGRARSSLRFPGPDTIADATCHPVLKP
jgi:cytochrome b561